MCYDVSCHVLFCFVLYLVCVSKCLHSSSETSIFVVFLFHFHLLLFISCFDFHFLTGGRFCGSHRRGELARRSRHKRQGRGVRESEVSTRQRLRVVRLLAPFRSGALVGQDWQAPHKTAAVGRVRLRARVRVSVSQSRSHSHSHIHSHSNIHSHSHSHSHICESVLFIAVPHTGRLICIALAGRC